MTDKEQNEVKKGVTILICTYNGAPRLEPTLKALLDQKDTGNIDWEVVLVDNASTDNTSEVATRLWNKKDIPFHLIHEPRPGRDNALKTGFSKAAYEYVCNVDDDTWVCEDYVKRVFNIMIKHPEVAVCGGQGFGEFEVEPPEWFHQFRHLLAIGPQGKEEGYVPREISYLYGACAVYRKSLWNALHKSGFQFFLSGRKGNKLNSGEDFELCQAWSLAGYRLWYDPEITFKHYMPAGRLTWKYFVKLNKAFGRADVIMQQYFKARGMNSNLRLKLLDSYLGNLSIVAYDMLKRMPYFLYASLFNVEGARSYLLSVRHMAYFAELLTNRKRYIAVKSVLNDAGWKKQFENVPA